MLIQSWTALTVTLMFSYMLFKSLFGGSLSNLVAMFRWNVFADKNIGAWLDHPFESPQSKPKEVLSMLPKFVV